MEFFDAARNFQTTNRPKHRRSERGINDSLKATIGNSVLQAAVSSVWRASVTLRDKLPR